jgi:hypothetical protein
MMSTAVLAETPQRPRKMTLPAGTFFRLRLNEDLSSKTAQVNDKFTARVTAPINKAGREVVPEGSTIHGRVTSVQRAVRRRNGTLGVSFNKLVLPNGNTYYIVGSLASLEDGKDVDDESRLKGKSTTKRNVLFIGGGAGVGAIIGAAAGGGSGAAIGGAIGAGAGTAAALLMKGHEAEAKAGTDIGMTLDREVAIVVKR